MVTLKEVAEAAGVSPATASRILNQDTTLSVQPSTRKKVLETAKKMQYNKLPKNPVEIGQTLGLLQWFSTMQEMEDTYYLSIRQGIEGYCQEQRIPLIRTFQQALNYVDVLNQAATIHSIGTLSGQVADVLCSLTRRILFLDMPTSQAACVTLDFKQAVTDALEYLVQLGHRSIGFLGGIEYLDEKEQEQFPDQRKDTFIRYCKEHDICYETYMYEGRFSVESGYQMMRILLEKETRPTAVFAASDPIAIGALRAMQDQGLRVPEDMSILGFNDINLSAFTTPPLTTVHAPSCEMGQYGAALVRMLSDLEASVPMRIQLPCRLVIRESCGKPRE